MGLLLLVPGIILLETDGWFKDQHTVGEVLTWVGGGLIALQILVFLLGLAGVAAIAKKDRF